MNPHDRLRSADFKSAASANFAIRAFKFNLLLLLYLTTILILQFCHLNWVRFWKMCPSFVSLSTFSTSSDAWRAGMLAGLEPVKQSSVQNMSRNAYPRPRGNCLKAPLVSLEANG